MHEAWGASVRMPARSSCSASPNQTKMVPAISCDGKVFTAFLALERAAGLAPGTLSTVAVRSDLDAVIVTAQPVGPPR